MKDLVQYHLRQSSAESQLRERETAQLHPKAPLREPCQRVCRRRYRALRPSGPLLRQLGVRAPAAEQAWWLDPHHGRPVAQAAEEDGSDDGGGVPEALGEPHFIPRWWARPQRVPDVHRLSLQRPRHVLRGEFP